MRARVLIVALICSAAMAASARAQGLGDAAKREKGRRAELPAKVEGKVITDEELAKYSSPELPHSPAVSSGEPSRPANSPTGSEESASDSGLPSDASKRKQAAEFKKQLEPIDAQIKEAEAKLATAEAVEAKAFDRRSVDYAHGRVEEARRQLAAARHRRELIEDAARKADIPPGWIR